MPPGARTIEQIYASLGSLYDPQVNSVQQRRNDIPNQLANEEQALAGKQNQAFDQILGGARARGVGFSGIPLDQQAKYTANTYMPALANMRGTFNSNAKSLDEAIMQINQQRGSQAQSIFDNERNYYEGVRQFDAQQAEAARARASAASSSAPDFSGIGAMLEQMAGGGGAPDNNAQRQQATNAMVGLFNTKNVATVANTIKAIQDSAKRGNTYDQLKLELLTMYQKNSPYANLISQALKYKAPAPKSQPQPKGYTPPTNFAFPANPLALKR